MEESDDQPEQTADDVFRTAVLFESALGIIAIFLGWTLGPDARALVPEISTFTADINVWWPVISGIFYGIAAALPIVAVIAILQRLPFESVRQLERLSDDGMIKVLLRLGPAEMLLISLCAGVGEELLFRGWLMQWLAGAPEAAGPVEVTIGLIGSSIAFGLVHPITRLYVVIAAVIGLYLGLLLIWTDNLLVPIAAHAAYDAIQLMLASRKQRRVVAT